MARRPLRPLFLLSAAALAPVSLGIAMHLDHVAAAAACTADLAAWTASPATETLAAPIVVLLPQTPIPVPIAEPMTEHALPFAYVIDIDGPHIVLSTEIEESWALDEPKFRPGANLENGVAPVWRTVSSHRLPISITANAGRTVRVYSADGEGCTARIGAMKLVGELWGDVADWAPDAREGGESTPPDASAAWESSRRTLVAALEIDGDCGTPLWARDVALPAPAVFVRTTGAVPRAARKAVFRDPEVRKLASELAESQLAHAEPTEPTKPPTLAERTTAQRWLDARGRELFTFSIASDDYGMCGGFDPAWAAFVPTGDAGVIALDRVGDEVLAVFDLERDGRIEVMSASWLGPTRLVEVGGEDALRERAQLDPVPFFGCPC